MNKIAKIGIGFGHTLSGYGSRNSTAKGYDMTESRANRIVGYKLVELCRHGFDVVVCNQDRPDKFKDENLLYRVNTANKNNVDIYVEQHLNGYNTKASGTSTLRYPGFHPNGIKSKKLATFIQLELVKALGLRDRGLSDRSDLYALRNTLMPAIIMEPLFMDNPDDMKRFDPDLIALAEATGIYKYYGKDINDYLPKQEIMPGIEKPTNKDGEPVTYRVVAGSFLDRDNAEKQVKRLADLGIKSFLTTYVIGE